MYASGERATIERIEVVGGYSSDGARGYGIGTYRLYSDHDGAQFVTIRDCYIHDGIATGIGINSNNNLILNNHIARVGLNSLSHGIYMQGGYNTYDGNTIEQATGYSFHGYKQVPSLDSSGDRIVNNTSINPGTGHALFQGQPNTANPTLPATANLNRHATVANNVFRGGANGVLSSNPIIVSNNVFEDVFGGTTISGGARSVITGNLIQQLSSTAGGTAIVARDLSVVADNQISTIGQVKAIDSQGAEVTIRDNVISMANAYARGIFIGGRDTWVDGNTIDASAAYDVIGFNNNLAGIRITNNRFNHTAGGQLANFGNLQTRAVSGVFQGNRLINGYIRYDVGSANFRMLDNSGSIVAYGVTSEGVGQP